MKKFYLLAVLVLVFSLVLAPVFNDKIFAEDVVPAVESSVVDEEIPVVEEVQPVVIEVEPVVVEVVEETTPTETSSNEETSPVEQTANLISAPISTPSLSTELPDYHPGETATIFGSLFSPLQSFVLKIFGGSVETEDYVESDHSVSSNSNGGFTFEYLLDNFYRPLYTVLAFNNSNEQIASVTFTDAGPGINLDQCQNGSLLNIASPCDGNPAPVWANGNINNSNSQYREADGLPYRLAITGLTDGDWVVRLQYDFTKGGIYALDRLTSYNLTQASNPCSGLSNCGTALQIDIPSEVVSPNLTTLPSLPSGGDLDIAGTPNTLFSSIINTQLTVWEYTNGNVSLVSVDPNVTQSGSALGDSTREFTFKINVSSCPNPTDCRVMVGWTGHIAAGKDWGPGKGAASISGAPFHMRVLGVDQTNGTSGGNQDRSVQLDFLSEVQNATLTLVKSVINDNGGTKQVSDFPLFIDGISVTSGIASTTSIGSHTLSETSQAGYTASSWSCVGGGSLNGSQITLAANENVTCTITNNDNAPVLHLRKVVTNNNGGTATVADFTLTANGTGANDLSGTSPVDSGAGLIADTWALSENSVTGYSASTWSCVGGTQDGSSITVGIGGEATCTITNDDIQPKLTLIKHVANDNGGTKGVSDFPLFVDATGVTSGVENGFNAGSYTASETESTGYSASSWSGDCAADGSITLSVGDDKTCHITNDDIAPILHLRKVLINDNGGPATLANFTLTANGTGDNDFSGTSPVDSGATLQSDTFALSETNLPGYIASPWVCVGGTQNGSNVTVGIGQEATCTITNNDTPGHFTGGGSIFPDVFNPLTILSGNGKSTKDTRVTHGFTLHCDVNRLPNRLEVNWGTPQNAQKFHLLTLTSATCTDNPAIDPQQPNADFDTITGTGIGRFQAGKNKEVDATITFKFDDAGEPGRNDTATMTITTAGGTVLNTIPLKLIMGNQQAHQDN